MKKKEEEDPTVSYVLNKELEFKIRLRTLPNDIKEIASVKTKIDDPLMSDFHNNPKSPSSFVIFSLTFSAFSCSSASVYIFSNSYNFFN